MAANKRIEAVVPASSGASSNHRIREYGGYWIARSNRAMTPYLKHLLVDVSRAGRTSSLRYINVLAAS